VPTTHETRRIAEPQMPPSCDALTGQQLLSVEKADYTWSFVFSGNVSVATESPWRLIAEGRVVVTSEDDGQQFGLSEGVDAASCAHAVIGGRTVETAAIDPPSGGLTIEFNRRARLQLLQMSSGYESWRLSAPGGEIICTGGGEITHFPSQSEQE
jgi:hypothetical protein